MKHICNWILFLSIGLVPMALSQQNANSSSASDNSTIASEQSLASNSWTNGTPMHRRIMAPAAAVLGGRIYVVGGTLDWNWNTITDMAIYNPVSDSWTKGVPLPAPIFGAAAIVVNNVLYIFGGNSGSGMLNTVWAYSPQTKKWSSRSPMPTARFGLDVVQKNGIVYAIGGQTDDWTRLNNVESYNPATDTWTEKAPLLQGKSQLTVGVVAGIIVAADGYSSNGDTGDNEGYVAWANAWVKLAADPTPRDAACGGAIGTRLYVASGYRGDGGSALPLTEVFTISNNAWATLADAPRPTNWAGSAVYQGRLYCFGGAVSYFGSTINNVQIYQP
jgi:N-acetylneuraminic acid mutarotase